ncbi:MAG: hypothetical protein IJ011_10150 [Clostridia bacterium]|nr:hypothetical protein [Clostridia bacterium]
MDNVQYLADELTMAKAKTTRTLATVALVLSGVYVLEGFGSILFALLPIPIIGFIISFILSVIEFALLVSSAVCGIIALVRACKLVKEIDALPDSEEKQSAFSVAKTARLLSIISVCVTGGACLVLAFLNIIELILSFI